MTNTIEFVDFSLIEHLDEDIPCEYSHHGRVGDENIPATWGIWNKNPLSCGCDASTDFRFFCDPCWKFRSDPGPVLCNSAKHINGSMDDIIRVERL